MNWPRQRLEELAISEPYSLIGGPFGSKLTSRDYVDEGIPVIRGSNVPLRSTAAGDSAGSRPLRRQDKAIQRTWSAADLFFGHIM